ncbi:hypothetical protein [Palaeococcus ferrophilus]|uniref:hypothetical protein n=1 Tax=Palaeococcus ferrophilus TaxID=83868 RepID=UPI00064F6E26|nr:hypothetical protein [Palaeococcus ferrophilus]
MRRLDPFFLLLALVAVLYLNVAYNLVTGARPSVEPSWNATLNVTLPRLELSPRAADLLYAALMSFVFVMFPIMALIHVVLSASR